MICTAGQADAQSSAAYRSHPAMRPLPQASDRPLAEGAAKFVDAEKGDDANAGTQAAPWKTLKHAFRQLQPGDTLYLFEASRQRYEPGWTAEDLVADPKFVSLPGDWRKPADLRLSSESPAINVGVSVPKDWPDPLRDGDAGKPDSGVGDRRRRPPLAVRRLKRIPPIGQLVIATA
jgi:hypothetical protein